MNRAVLAGVTRACVQPQPTFDAPAQRRRATLEAMVIVLAAGAPHGPLQAATAPRDAAAFAANERIGHGINYGQGQNPNAAPTADKDFPVIRAAGFGRDKCRRNMQPRTDRHRRMADRAPCGLIAGSSITAHFGCQQGELR